MLTCNRCNKMVPDGQLACACFIAHAEEEKVRLALKRFFNREVIMFLRDGHIYPESKNTRSICGVSDIKHYNDKKTTTIKPIDLLSGELEENLKCESCRKLMGLATDTKQ